MEHAVIELCGVGKRYGTVEVLRNISLKLEKGKIYGLVGRNGSGKTMLMKVICGFVLPTEGTVTVRGKVLGKDVDIPGGMGVIIEQPGFLPEYSAYQNLDFLRRIRGTTDRRKITEMLNKVGLGDTGRKKVGKFSMGMRQRLALAQALLEDPDILILDEPMNGLDRNGVKEIRKLLAEQKAEGKTILIATHVQEDIEALCDEVFHMESGEIVRDSGAVSAVPERSSGDQ